ncbi:MAG: YtxH domain-containing protein [Gemmatimonadales bacterium]|jgi:hypothetical protein
MSDFDEEEAPVAPADDDQDEEDAMEHEEHRARTFVAGLAIGALVGAGLALLFAPQSGEKTRRLVSRKAKHLAREARNRYDDVKEKVRRARRDRGGERGVDEAGAE